MTEKKKIEIRIDGRNFTVVGNKDEEYIKSLASYVNDKIKSLTSKNSRLCQTTAATLAALNISDELQSTKDKLLELESKAKDPIEKYGSINNELSQAKEEIENLEKEIHHYKDQLLKTKLESENLLKEISNQKQVMGIKESELTDSQKMIKNLQDKIYNNQIELIETKKELREVLKVLDDKNKVLIKEEV